MRPLYYSMLLLFKDGKEAQRSVGFVPKAKLRTNLGL